MSYQEKSNPLDILMEINNSPFPEFPESFEVYTGDDYDFDFV